MKTLAEIRRETDVVLRASAKLLMGKRLEIRGKAGTVDLHALAGDSIIHAFVVGVRVGLDALASDERMALAEGVENT